MKTLICDLNVYDNGHHIAFVNSILNFCADREDLLFLFNGKAASFCNGMEGDKRITLIPEDQLVPELKSNLIDKCREYRLVERFALKHQIDRVIFLEIDWYQVAIGLFRPPFRITGIYFRPFHLIPKNTLYHLKKRALFYLMKSNRKVEPLFLLNDRQAGIRYPSWFRFLPDPIFDNASPGVNGLSIRRLFGIAPSAHIILAFGAMGPRKNITNIVAAYRQASFTRDTVLLIAGKVRADYREEFDAAVNSFIVNADPRKKLVVFDQFVDEDHIDPYFREAGSILLCYSKFFGSSGLMGKAAQHRKTCIVPDCGLLNDLNREYKLGYPVNPDDVASIAGALALAERQPMPADGFHRYVHDHHENAFLRTLLSV